MKRHREGPHAPAGGGGAEQRVDVASSSKKQTPVGGATAAAGADIVSCWALQSLAGCTVRCTRSAEEPVGNPPAATHKLK